MMPAEPLTLDEAMRCQCEHGISLVVVCPKCHPEKYILSEEETKRLQEKFKEYATLEVMGCGSASLNG